MNKVASAILALSVTVCMVTGFTLDVFKTKGFVSKEKETVSEEVELLFKTDTEKDDTDGDGLSDYIEIYLTCTDPTLKDTDANGVSDGDEDCDGDGISNLEEIKLGTEPDKTDSDNDSISDYDEISVYKTNPCSVDTDEDGLPDGDELLLGLNPLVRKTDGITLDSERKFSQTVSQSNIDDALLADDSNAVPSLTATVSGNINRSVKIDKTSSNDFSDSRAIVGKAVDISGENLSDGKLSFELRNAAQSDYDKYLLCKYEDGKTEYLNTNYDGSSVSAEIDGEGTYFVMDAEALFNELGLEYPTSNSAKKPLEKEGVAAMAQADIVFIVDTTGSMADEIDNVKENIADFVDVLKEKGVSAGLALVEYKDIENDGYDATKVSQYDGSNWYYDIDKYKESLSALSASCGGDPNESVIDALETARLLDMRASAGKIFVLVTDSGYKTENRYSIDSMESEITLLKNAGINCSVITVSMHIGTYFNLYKETGGVYANINGDFNTELTNIADKIGDEIVGDGCWIYLQGPVPVPVRLDKAPAYGSTADTDGDGILDIKELETVTPDGYVDLDEIITAVSKGAITSTNYGTVMTYRYKSNPIEPDTDFDGTLDFEDSMPNSNECKGIMHYTLEGAAKTCNIEFSMDYRDLISGNNQVYSDDLSVLSILYASDVYDGLNIEITQGGQTGGNDDATTFGSLLGLEDGQYINISSGDYDVDKDDITDFYVGHRNIVFNDEINEVVVVSVRGTNGTNTEWSSNFDVGADTDEYYSATGSSHPDWKDKNNHKGFDVAANRVITKLNAYLDKYVDPYAKKYILITGHSRGAAIANILGKQFEENSEYISYTYTFATPNSTTASNAASYKTIFNVVNQDDIIPFLPIEEWNFKNYGTTKSVSVSDYYESSSLTAAEGTFEWLLGYDYNDDSGTQRTLNSFAAIANTREELYMLDTTDDGKVWENNLGHTTYNGAVEELNELSQTLENEKLLRFCKLYIVKKLFIYYVEVNYCPAYLMQTLANMTTGTGPLLGHDVKGKYATAKTAFVASSGVLGIGGMTHPHMQPTYYLMAHNKLQPLS